MTVIMILQRHYIDYREMKGTYQRLTKLARLRKMLCEETR